MKTTPRFPWLPGGRRLRLLPLVLLLPGLTLAQRPAVRSVALNSARPPATAPREAPAAPETPPAPAAVAALTAARTPQGALLTWEAAAARAGARFDVERSADGLSFRAVGTVPTRPAGATYQFLDPAPGPEAVYYRLRHATGFSEVLPLRAAAAEWELAPNPAADWLSCGTASGDYCIRDAAKRTVLSGHLGAGQRIDLRRLRNGSYTLELRTGSQRVARTFVKYAP